MLYHRELIIRDRRIDLIEPEGALAAAGVLLDELNQCVRELLSHGRRDIRVGLRLVTNIDSAGLGTLAALCGGTIRQGGHFVIDWQGNKRVGSAFAIARLAVLGDDDPEGTAGVVSPLIPPPRPWRPSIAKEPERDDDPTPM